VFVRVGRHRVTLAKAGDLDGDGIPDARYTTVWFHKPHGTYRVIAKSGEHQLPKLLGRPSVQGLRFTRRLLASLTWSRA
jgi:hypothetical protein